MTSRDPRVDPKSGDVLLVGPQVSHPTIRTVTAILISGERRLVLWRNQGRNDTNMVRSISTWRKWAKQSVVLAPADDAQGGAK